MDENIQASLDEAINIMEQSLNAVRMKMYGDFGDHSAVSTTALKVGLRDLKIDYCFIHPNFRFWFGSLLATKLQKYYVIFVYILHDKMGKTEQKRKEKYASKVTKIPKTKRKKYVKYKT